jgi:hypothetical protein
MIGTLGLQLLLTITVAAGGGLVEVQRNNVWTQIQTGEQVNIGERVRTGTFSSAVLELSPGKMITLGEETEVQLRDSNGSPLVRLESGAMRVFSATDIQVAARDTMLESVERPLDMQVGFQADRLSLMVFSGAVKNGAMTIRGMQDPGARTYTAGGHWVHRGGTQQPVYSNFYIYPYFPYGYSGNTTIVPPTVTNPTNPGYRPDQIVPPMTDPIRPPVQVRPNR